MTEQGRPSICLDIAIDHRLLPLFQPLHANSSKQESKHVSLLRKIAQTLRREEERIPEAEVATAVDLAGPATTGGICFVLQQPANNHPYDLGTDSVITSSPTLRALLVEIWPTVSCGAPKPTVVDRLPFIRPSDQIDPRCKSHIQEQSFAMIQEKKPDVVVCMWRRKRSGGKRQVDDLGSMHDIEGLGVGHKFTTIECELRPGCTIRRVNAFHPSFAVNYNPHMSCFRQLLILEVAHACGLYRGQWRNEDWMDELRDYCQDKVQKICNSVQVNLHLFGADYRSNLEAIKAFASSSSANRRRCCMRTQYSRLVKSRVSGYSNDASLCIRALHLKKKLTDDDVKAFDDAATDTTAFLECLVLILLPRSKLTENNVLGAPGVYDERALDKDLVEYNQVHGSSIEEVREMLLETMKQLNSSFNLVELYPDRRYTYHLHRWDSTFLSLASRLELLLGKLAIKLSRKSGDDSDLAEKFHGLLISENK